MAKRLLGPPAIFMLAIFLCACAHMQDNALDKPLNEYLISNSISITCTMDSLAQNDEYVKLVSGAPELGGAVAEIGADEYSAPNNAVLITVPDTTADAAIKNMAGELDLSEEAYEQAVARMLSAVPNMINAQQGAMSLAAASALNANEVLRQHKDFAANTYVVLAYDNRGSVTLFRKSAEGTITASSTFLFFNEELKTALAEETIFDYFFQLYSIGGFEVEYVAGDTIAGYQMGNAS
jgi:hypothetical protein